MRPGYRDIIQRNTRRILRRPPVLPHPRDPKLLVYAPIRHRGTNVSVKLLKVASTETDRVQNSSWEEVFPTPSAARTVRTEYDMNRDGPTEIRFGTLMATTQSERRGSTTIPMSGNMLVASNWLNPGEEDTVLPPYGESGTDDYPTDEELFREIAREEREKLDRLKRPGRRPLKSKKTSQSPKELTAEEVATVLQEHIQFRKELWTKRQLPKLELRAHKIYSEKSNLLGDIEEELVHLETKRLPDFKLAITSGKHTSKEALERACKALDNTLDLICELQWKRILLNGPEPAKPDKVLPRIKAPKESSTRGMEDFQMSDEDSAQGANETSAADGDHIDEDTVMLSGGDHGSDGDYEDDSSSDDEDDGSDMGSFIVHDSDSEEVMSTKDPETRQRLRSKTRASSKEKGKKIAAVAPPLDLFEDEDHGPGSEPADDIPADEDVAFITTTVATRTMTSATKVIMETPTTTKDVSASPSIPLASSSSSPIPQSPAGRKATTIEKSPEPERTRPDAAIGDEDNNTSDAMQMDQWLPDDIASEVDGGHDGEKSHSPPTVAPMGPPEDVQRHLFGRKSPVDEEERGLDALSRRLGLAPDWPAVYPDDDALIAALTKVRKDFNVGKIVQNTEYAIYLEYIDWKTFAVDEFDDDFRGFLQWKRSGRTRDDLLKDLRAMQEEEARQREAELAREEAERKEREEQARRRRQQAELARKEAERERTRQQAKAATVDAIMIASGSEDDEVADSNAGATSSSARRPQRQRKRPLLSSSPVGSPAGGGDDDATSGRKRGGGGEGRGGQESTSATRQAYKASAGPSVIPAKRTNPHRPGRPRRGAKSSRHHLHDSNAEESVEDLSSANEVSETDQGEDWERHRHKMLKMPPDTDQTDELGRTSQRRMFKAQPRPRRHKRSLVERDVIETEDVIRLREAAARSKKALEERVLEQEERNKELQARHAASVLGKGGLGITVEEGEVLDVHNLVNIGFKQHPIYFPPWMARELKPHQKEGVRFLWKNVVMLENGCILAHSMGLGKTFQIVAFIYLLLTELRKGNPDIPKFLQEGSVLVVCPATIAQNWMDEFRRWIPESEYNSLGVATFGKETRVAERIMMLQKWRSTGGVFIMGNEMFRDMASASAPAVSNQPDLKAILAELLLSPGPSVMFLDEGHSLKNSQAKLSVVAKQIKTPGRVILTGYPLQNRLEEYWNMVDFVRPNYLGDSRTFRANYVQPIERGLYPDSTIGERKLASKRLAVLTELIKDFVQRKDSSVLVATLPKKVEYVIVCSLTPLQRELYVAYLRLLESEKHDGMEFRSVLGLGQVLTNLCNHPAIFKSCINRHKTKRHLLGRSLMPVGGQSASLTASTPILESNLMLSTMQPPPPSTLGSNVAEPIQLESDEEVERQVAEVVSSSEFQYPWQSIRDLEAVSHSNKMSVLVDLLKFCQMKDEKTLVFSRSIPTLDFIEHHICKPNRIGYKRIDGDIALHYRPGRVHAFNTDKDLNVLLISTGSGAQGINLYSASRVIIVDVGWNPSVDEQAVARAFRYGQGRAVYVYRLQTYGTWEEKVHKTNVHKLNLSKRVIDEKNMARNYNRRQLKDYFEIPPATAPQWGISDDRVEGLFERHPEVEEDLIRELINKHRQSLTLVVPHSQFTLEEQSDLTQEDRDDINKMLESEKQRIHNAANPPPLPPPPPASNPTTFSSSTDTGVARPPEPATGIPPLTGSGAAPQKLLFKDIISIALNSPKRTSPQLSTASGSPTLLQPSSQPAVPKATTMAMTATSTATTLGVSHHHNHNSKSDVVTSSSSTNITSSAAQVPVMTKEELAEMHLRAPVWKPAVWLSNGVKKATNIELVMKRIGTLSPEQASKQTGLMVDAFGREPEISWDEAKRMVDAQIDVRTLPASSLEAVKVLKGGYVLYENQHQFGLRRATIVILNPSRTDLHHVLPPQPPKEELDEVEDGDVDGEDEDGEKDVVVVEDSEVDEVSDAVGAVAAAAAASSPSHAQSGTVSKKRVGRPHKDKSKDKRKDKSKDKKFKMPYGYTPAEMIKNVGNLFGEYFTASLMAFQCVPEAYKFVFVNLTPIVDQAGPAIQHTREPTIQQTSRSAVQTPGGTATQQTSRPAVQTPGGSATQQTIGQTMIQRTIGHPSTTTFHRFAR
ncbi:hypothetical protein DFQ27_006175 [Actinomortierella ambigua]|uniref:Uncharacterized protein n=1 Tax=Actinomortierella ambigua TaxID=1343610 RepID=A0A9P6PZ97_9FUNG|nr:hypothetical protein DFQ27_006175 [Actinomortierella ambigua]